MGDEEDEDAREQDEELREGAARMGGRYTALGPQWEAAEPHTPATPERCMRMAFVDSMYRRTLLHPCFFFTGARGLGSFMLPAFICLSQRCHILTTLCLTTVTQPMPSVIQSSSNPSNPTHPFHPTTVTTSPSPPSPSPSPATHSACSHHQSQSHSL